MIDKFDSEYLKENYPDSKIHVSKNKNIGEGNFGRIFKLILGIKEKKNSYTKVDNYIIKEFKYSNKDSKELVNHNIKVWEVLIENKIPTFNIFKKYTNKSILMEDLTIPNNYCISPSNIGDINLDQKDFLINYHVSDKSLEIDNFKDIIIEIFLYCDKLKKNNCAIKNSDVFFYIVDKENTSKLKVIFGDFDKIELNSENIGDDNFKYFYMSFHSYLYYYISSSKERDKYYKILDEVYYMFKNSKK